MICNDKTALVASSAGNAERLATSSYSMLVPEVVRQFAIVSIQSNMLGIDRHGIHNTVSIDRATLAPSNELSINVSQRFPVEKDFLMDHVANGQNTQTAPNEYTVDRVDSHKGSGNILRYCICWYGYLQEHETLETRSNHRSTLNIATGKTSHSTITDIGSDSTANSHYPVSCMAKSCREDHILYLHIPFSDHSCKTQITHDVNVKKPPNCSQ